MSQISGQMEWLLETLEQDYSVPVPPEAAKIKLSQLVGKLGFFYEKVRNAVDYNEEHLIRRNSINRFLRRNLFLLQEKDALKISQALIFEFIRAKYLPNDSLPESAIDELGAIIGKYVFILSKTPGAVLGDLDRINEWVVTLASCEIDEYFFSPEKDLAMANLMYSHLIDNLAFTKSEIDEKEKNLQIYIAVLKNLLKADPSFLAYRLLKLYFPDWNSLDEAKLLEFIRGIKEIKEKIDKRLHHPLAYQLSQTVRPQSVFFRILRQIIDENPAVAREILSDPTKLESVIKEICNRNYKSIRNKLVGSIIRVIIYILLTKTILAFAIEFPYDKFFVGVVNWRSLLINVIFHPTLMFVVAMTIKVPGEKNTKIIIEQIKKIIYGEQRKVVFKPKKRMKRGSLGYIAFNVFYTIMFAISFGIVIFVLRLIHFNIISGLLFIFFLTLVSFFGFRLRNLANQYLVIPRKDNFANFLTDFLTLPIIRAGRFFSTNFSRINIFLFILDFIIETPFKFVVEASEKAVSFVKDKRDEISE